MIIFLRRIDVGLPGYDAVFRRNIVLPSSGLKMELCLRYVTSQDTNIDSQLAIDSFIRRPSARVELICLCCYALLLLTFKLISFSLPVCL